ncbi:DUF4199 domain-containing protein [Muricauda sp. SCSIO 64092]|uniref:DUF4199 domain-containing protein n=1 Tax=Allomuricauda sp. SCSIO 64092 TaxID=2908842 RepID=UPI001FF45E9C|nr:DUF4199 domain-containing protein [Muricauda sp. SCSIO 64092]UOY07034.1 DUF4199 domain-containing protein [Muricauda sp. SCSIO 64092]
MEGQDLKTQKHILTYGGLAGLVGVVFGIMLYTQGLHYERSFTIQAIQYGILAVFIVIGIVQYKKSNENYLKIGQAIKIGAGIGVIATIIGIIWFYLMSGVLEPDYMDKAMEIAKVEAFEANPKMTQEQWDQGVEFQKKFFPIFMGVGVLLSAIFGLVVGLITGAIVKKPRPSY